MNGPPLSQAAAKSITSIEEPSSLPRRTPRSTIAQLPGDAKRVTGAAPLSGPLLPPRARSRRSRGRSRGLLVASRPRTNALRSLAEVALRAAFAERLRASCGERRVRATSKLSLDPKVVNGAGEESRGCECFGGSRNRRGGLAVEGACTCPVAAVDCGGRVSHIVSDHGAAAVGWCGPLKIHGITMTLNRLEAADLSAARVARS